MVYQAELKLMRSLIQIDRLQSLFLSHEEEASNRRSANTGTLGQLSKIHDEGDGLSAAMIIVRKYRLEHL